MKIHEIKTNADLHKFVKNFYETHATALNGIIEKLPESLRAELLSLRNSLNDSLKALPPLDQVPAAQEASWAFNSFADAVVRMQEYSNGLLEKLTGLKKDLDAKATALNGLEERVQKGELVSKDKVKELCELARGEGANAFKPEIVATRKSALELAGLPLPGEDVLGLPAEAYNARLATARENIKKLAEKGFKRGGKGDAWIRQTAWLGATEFAGQMSMIEDFIPSLKGETKADPLLGNQAPETPSQAQAATSPAITLA